MDQQNNRGSARRDFDLNLPPVEEEEEMLNGPSDADRINIHTSSTVQPPAANFNSTANQGLNMNPMRGRSVGRAEINNGVANSATNTVPVAVTNYNHLSFDMLMSWLDNLSRQYNLRRTRDTINNYRQQRQINTRPATDTTFPPPPPPPTPVPSPPRTYDFLSRIGQGVNTPSTATTPMRPQYPHHNNININNSNSNNSSNNNSSNNNISNNINNINILGQRISVREVGESSNAAANHNASSSAYIVPRQLVPPGNYTYYDPLRRCSICNTFDTPMWRGGPLGPRTLCNACGIKHGREKRKRQDDDAQGK